MAIHIEGEYFFSRVTRQPPPIFSSAFTGFAGVPKFRNKIECQRTDLLQIHAYQGFVRLIDV